MLLRFVFRALILLLDAFVWYECLEVAAWLMMQPSDFAVLASIVLTLVSTTAVAAVFYQTIKIYLPSNEVSK